MITLSNSIVTTKMIIINDEFEILELMKIKKKNVHFYFSDDSFSFYLTIYNQINFFKKFLNLFSKE